MTGLLSPLGRAPGLSEFPQSPFLLQVHGLAGAKSFNMITADLWVSGPVQSAGWHSLTYSS